MPSSNNRAIIACAGSGKTQYVTDEVLARPDERTLVTTYTNENHGELQRRLTGRTGVVPRHIDTRTWLAFLLNECARPYQNTVFGGPDLMRNLHFEKVRNYYIPKSDPRRYYLDSRQDVYRDKLAELVCAANERSGGLVIDRLAGIYNHIYIDEVQDLAGYDFELLDLLMDSPISLTMVGDPRQATYWTNDSRKNRQYKRRVDEWFNMRADRCDIIPRTASHRCVQVICDFADDLYPHMDRTTSANTTTTGHDGIFVIKSDEVADYVKEWDPTILRWNKNAYAHGLRAMNIGRSKGRTFDRVLIFPTKPIRDYLDHGDPEQLKAQQNLYVAVTRARQSVTFVADQS